MFASAGELIESMQHYRVPIQDDSRTVSFEAPWANAVSLTVDSTSLRTDPRGGTTQNDG